MRKILILSDPNSIHTKRWVSSLSKDNDILLLGLSKEHDSYYKSFNNVIVKSTIIGKNVFTRIKAYICFFYICKKYLNSFTPDIIHAHYASSYGLIGALLDYHPFIISIWGSDVYSFPRKTPFHKHVLKFNLKCADKILSTSSIMARECQKYTNKAIEITPFGVDINKFQKCNIHKSDNTIVIGNVKSLSNIYGIDILIKAFALVVKWNVDKILKLDIIGDGPDKNTYLELAKTLSLQDNIHFRGRIDNSSLPDYYSRFDIAVYPSREESFGVAAIEAMSCECAVVTSDADGFKEVISNNETGIIVPKENIESLANAIQFLIDHPSIRSKMGIKGRERVVKYFNWENNVTLMNDIYTKITN